MTKYIDAELLQKEIEKHIEEVKDAAERFTPNLGFFDAKLSGIYDVMAIIDSLQQEPDKNLEEAAEKYRRASCNAAMKPNIDGPIPEYGGNVKAAFIAGALYERGLKTR